MKNLFRSLFIALLALGLNPTGATDTWESVPMQDIDECKVRKQDGMGKTTWQVHDPKFDAYGEFNSLQAVSKINLAPTSGCFEIDEMTFSNMNTSKIRAVNALFTGMLDESVKAYMFPSAKVLVWVENEVLGETTTRFSETLLGKLLSSRFGFKIETLHNPLGKDVTSGGVMGAFKKDLKKSLIHQGSFIKGDSEPIRISPIQTLISILARQRSPGTLY